MDSRQQQAIYLSVSFAAALVVILPYWIVSINFWWPTIHLPLPWIVRMATAPIVLLPIAAVGAWGGSKYRKSGGFEQPYWKRKRSRFEIGIRWVVLVVFLGPLIAYLGYRA